MHQFKLQLLATVTLLATALPALADGNGGPQAANNQFLVWQQQGAAGKAFTPAEVLAGRVQQPAEVAAVPGKVRVN